MHGFPDNHHLYDRLVPHLQARHVVVFDFLGWGESDKPEGYEYTFANQVGDLDAVIAGLGLESVVLVPHDASGPAAINWAVEHPRTVASIVALNTFYGIPPDGPINPPEAIRLFSDPAFRRLTEAFANSPREFRWLYEWQVGGFIRDDEVREEFVPLLYRQFEARPSSIEAFVKLNADLNAAVLANTQRAPQLRVLPRPRAHRLRRARRVPHAGPWPQPRGSLPTRGSPDGRRCGPLPATRRAHRGRAAHPHRSHRGAVTKPGRKPGSRRERRPP